MKQKSNLHEALKNTPRKSVPSSTEVVSTKKNLIVQISFDAHVQIDQMKRDLRKKSMKALVQEALNDLFTKYKYPPIA